jgi:electron transfer flavoprotein alpha subunit
LDKRNSVLILAEQRNGRLHAVTYELLHSGRRLADTLEAELSCAVIGAGPQDWQELIYRGADRIYAVNAGNTNSFTPGAAAAALTRLIREENPAVVVAAATTYGRTVMPLVAVRLETGLTADCTELGIDPESGLLLQTRPAIGGNVMATIKTPFTRPQMATVRPHCLPPAAPDHKRQGEVVTKSYPVLLGGERFLRFVQDVTQTVTLQEAEVVVTGGRGMKSQEGFRLVEELADALGAGVGATRAAVELGWASYAHQIGLSGKTVSPKVYIAAGVSGQIQHLAGMQTSEYIVAINKDPDAQIFKVADLGLVGDALEIVPRLTAEIKKRKAAT